MFRIKSDGHLEEGIIEFDTFLGEEVLMWCKKEHPINATQNFYTVNRDEFMKVSECSIERLNKKTFKISDETKFMTIRMKSPKETDYMVDHLLSKFV